MSHSPAHLSLSVTPSLTLHALLRPGQSDPCFSIREIDAKLLRENGHGVASRRRVAVTSSSAQLNEQAARVKARQLMLSYTKNLIEATKEEIRWLKDSGVLGKRAPKSSLMAATFLLELLRQQSKTTLAAHIHNALVGAKLGKWKTTSKLTISDEEQAAEQLAQVAAQQAAEEEEEAAAAAATALAEAGGGANGDDDADMHADETMHEGEGHEDQDTSPQLMPIYESRPRRRSSSTHKRKNGASSHRYPGEPTADEEDDDSPPPQRPKRSRKNGASGGGGYSTTQTPTSTGLHSLGSLGGVPSLSLSSAHAPPNMVGKAVLVLNPRDRSTPANATATAGHSSSRKGVHFGADRSAGMTVVKGDGCTLVGPVRGAATARASHGITSGSWYIEVKGSEIAAQAMRAAAAADVDAGTAAAASLMDDAPPHCRIGFATAACQLETKLLGYDAHSYAYGDRYGDKIHEGEASEYGDPFAIFASMDARDPSQHHQQQQPPHSHSHPATAAAAVEPEGDTIGMFIELGIEVTGLPPPSASAAPPASSHEPASSPTAVSPKTGNRISFYKNGECQGLAWEDLPLGLTWYPAISLINGMSVTVDFKVGSHASKPMAAASSNMATTSTAAAAAATANTMYDNDANGKAMHRHRPIAAVKSEYPQVKQERQTPSHHYHAQQHQQPSHYHSNGREQQPHAPAAAAAASHLQSSQQQQQAHPDYRGPRSADHYPPPLPQQHHSPSQMARAMPPMDQRERFNVHRQQQHAHYASQAQAQLHQQQQQQPPASYAGGRLTYTAGASSAVPPSIDSADAHTLEVLHHQERFAHIQQQRADIQHKQMILAQQTALFHQHQQQNQQQLTSSVDAPRSVSLSGGFSFGSGSGSSSGLGGSVSIPGLPSGSPPSQQPRLFSDSSPRVTGIGSTSGDLTRQPPALMLPASEDFFHARGGGGGIGGTGLSLGVTPSASPNNGSGTPGTAHGSAAAGSAYLSTMSFGLGRQLRVPSGDDDLHSSLMPPMANSLGGSPSPLPGYPLISPVPSPGPSPLPVQMSTLPGSGGGGMQPAYSLSNSNTPLIGDQEADRFLEGFSTAQRIELNPGPPTTSTL